jgi:hypothetical protein
MSANDSRSFAANSSFNARADGRWCDCADGGATLRRGGGSARGLNWLSKEAAGLVRPRPWDGLLTAYGLPPE